MHLAAIILIIVATILAILHVELGEQILLPLAAMCGVGALVVQISADFDMFLNRRRY